jgi:hypothetical protein
MLLTGTTTNTDLERAAVDSDKNDSRGKRERNIHRIRLYDITLRHPLSRRYSKLQCGKEATHIYVCTSPSLYECLLLKMKEKKNNNNGSL